MGDTPYSSYNQDKMQNNELQYSEKDGFIFDPVQNAYVPIPERGQYYPEGYSAPQNQNPQYNESAATQYEPMAYEPSPIIYDQPQSYEYTPSPDAANPEGYEAAPYRSSASYEQRISYEPRISYNPPAYEPIIPAVEQIPLYEQTPVYEPVYPQMTYQTPDAQIYQPTVEPIIEPPKHYDMPTFKTREFSADPVYAPDLMDHAPLEQQYAPIYSEPRTEPVTYHPYRPEQAAMHTESVTSVQRQKAPAVSEGIMDKPVRPSESSSQVYESGRINQPVPVVVEVKRPAEVTRAAVEQTVTQVALEAVKPTAPQKPAAPVIVEVKRPADEMRAAESENSAPPVVLEAVKPTAPQKPAAPVIVEVKRPADEMRAAESENSAPPIVLETEKTAAAQAPKVSVMTEKKAETNVAAAAEQTDAVSAEPETEHVVPIQPADDGAHKAASVEEKDDLSSLVEEFLSLNLGEKAQQPIITDAKAEEIKPAEAPQERLVEQEAQSLTEPEPDDLIKMGIAPALTPKEKESSDIPENHVKAQNSKAAEIEVQQSDVERADNTKHADVPKKAASVEPNPADSAEGGDFEPMFGIEFDAPMSDNFVVEPVIPEAEPVVPKIKKEQIPLESAKKPDKTQGSAPAHEAETVNFGTFDDEVNTDGESSPFFTFDKPEESKGVETMRFNGFGDEFPDSADDLKSSDSPSEGLMDKDASKSDEFKSEEEPLEFAPLENAEGPISFGGFGEIEKDNENMNFGSFAVSEDDEPLSFDNFAEPDDGASPFGFPDFDKEGEDSSEFGGFMPIDDGESRFGGDDFVNFGGMSDDGNSAFEVADEPTDDVVFPSSVNDSDNSADQVAGQDKTEDEADEPQFGGFGSFGDIVEDEENSDFGKPSLSANLFDTAFIPPAGNPDDTEHGEIFDIANNLGQAVLSRSYNESFTDNNLISEGKNLVLGVNNITSEYYVSDKGSQPYAMFTNASFALREGACLAMVSEIPLASYALARAISESYDNAEPNVTLSDNEDEAPREILYVGSDALIPEEMTCIQFLLYVLSGVKGESAAEREERVRQVLSQVGLGEFEDDLMADMSHNKRLLVLTLSAALNPNIGCVIFNDSSFNIEGVEENIAKRVFALLGASGKCSILSCCSKYLMATVANRVLVINRGHVVFNGSYRKFIDGNCLGIMSFTTNNAKNTVDTISKKFPNVTALNKGNLVYLIRKDDGDVDIDELLQSAMSLGAEYNSVVMDDKSFEVALKEVLSL